MIFEQVLNRDLGCASYLLGDAGEAVVVDPRFDIDVYLQLAGRYRLRIDHVIDTHDHADHVSGRAKLAAATGARAYRACAPGEAGDDRIHPGDELTVGGTSTSAITATMVWPRNVYATPRPARMFPFARGLGEGRASQP